MGQILDSQGRDISYWFNIIIQKIICTRRLQYIDCVQFDVVNFVGITDFILFSFL